MPPRHAHTAACPACAGLSSPARALPPLPRAPQARCPAATGGRPWCCCRLASPKCGPLGELTLRERQGGGWVGGVSGDGWGGRRREHPGPGGAGRVGHVPMRRCPFHHRHLVCLPPLRSPTQRLLLRVPAGAAAEPALPRQHQNAGLVQPALVRVWRVPGGWGGQRCLVEGAAEEVLLAQHITCHAPSTLFRCSPPPRRRSCTSGASPSWRAARSAGRTWCRREQSARAPACCWPTASPQTLSRKICRSCSRQISGCCG